MRGLRLDRQQMKDARLVHGESQFPVSLTLIAALVLLLIGFVAIVDMTFGVSLFGGQ
jgi:putative membrane protein